MIETIVTKLTIGCIIGFLASVPLGPIGVLCVQRTLTKKFLGGYVSALGAAVADTIFATVALFAISFIMPYINAHKFTITLIGGFIIMFMGFKIFMSKISRTGQIKQNRQSKFSLMKDFLSVFFMTISNPAYISIFLVLFASFSINGDDMDPSQQFATIFGVFIGASLWWFVLTFSISLVREKFKPMHIFYFNKVAGVVIFIIGILALIKAFIQ